MALEKVKLIYKELEGVVRHVVTDVPVKPINKAVFLLERVSNQAELESFALQYRRVYVAHKDLTMGSEYYKKLPDTCKTKVCFVMSANKEVVEYNMLSQANLKSESLTLRAPRVAESLL